MRGASSQTQYEARIVTYACALLCVTAGEVVETCPAARGLSFCGAKYLYPTAMDLVAEALAHLLFPCRVVTDKKPPSYSHLGADRLHRDACNQDMAMAPRSGHVSTTSPAVTQSNSHASVTILASYWVFDEVPVIYSCLHVVARPYGQWRVSFCREQALDAADLDSSLVACVHCLRLLADALVCRQLSSSLLWLACSCWSRASCDGHGRLPCTDRRCTTASRISLRGTVMICIGVLSLSLSAAVTTSKCGAYMLRGLWDVHQVPTHCCFHKPSAHIPRNAVEHVINGRHGPDVKLAW